MSSAGLRCAAAFLSGASSAAAAVTVSAAAGLFQYYDNSFLPRAQIGPAAALAARYERLESAYELEGRYRQYSEGAAETGLELRARCYFHPAPARPYVGPAVGFWWPKEEARGYKVVGVGARAGAVLAGAGGRLEVDVFGAYRGRFNLTEERFRPDFNSELAAGAAASWRVAGGFAVTAEAALLWPGFFAERHGLLWGPGVAPLVLAGPAFRF
jgi:hypothetical protein